MGAQSTAWRRCACTLACPRKRGSSTALAVLTVRPLASASAMMPVEIARRTSASSASSKPLGDREGLRAPGARAGAHLEVALLRAGHLDDEPQRVLEEGAEVVARAELEEAEEEVALQPEAREVRRRSRGGVG